MALATPSSLVPGEHLIVVAVRPPHIARFCEQILTAQGYQVGLCPEEATADDVMAAVQTHPPRLLLLDEEIEWAEGVPLILRLCADSAFAAIPILAFLRCCNYPTWMCYNLCATPCMTKPFHPRELETFVKRMLEAATAEGALSFPDLPAASTRTEEGWQLWKRQLPPFALFDAAWNGDQARVERLLEEGADVRAKDFRGSTILHTVAGKGNLPLVRFLLQHGVEVNARNDQGETPLWKAAEKAHMVVMHLLLKHGADPDLPNSDGETPLLQLRKFRGETDEAQRQLERTAALLLQYGAHPNRAGVQQKEGTA